MRYRSHSRPPRKPLLAPIRRAFRTSHDSVPHVRQSPFVRPAAIDDPARTHLLGQASTSRESSHGCLRCPASVLQCLRHCTSPSASAGLLELGIERLDLARPMEASTAQRYPDDRDDHAARSRASPGSGRASGRREEQQQQVAATPAPTEHPCTLPSFVTSCLLRLASRSPGGPADGIVGDFNDEVTDGAAFDVGRDLPAVGVRRRRGHAGPVRCQRLGPAQCRGPLRLCGATTVGSGVRPVQASSPAWAAGLRRAGRPCPAFDANAPRVKRPATTPAIAAPSRKHPAGAGELANLLDQVTGSWSRGT